MKDFCIVGTGISGSTIANLLKKKYSIQVIDKAKGLGGRSSNKRYKKLLSFDHGLQFISPKTKEFKKFILNLESKKVVKKWKGLHIDLLNNKDDSRERVAPERTIFAAGFCTEICVAHSKLHALVKTQSTTSSFYKSIRPMEKLSLAASESFSIGYFHSS